MVAVFYISFSADLSCILCNEADEVKVRTRQL